MSWDNMSFLVKSCPNTKQGGLYYTYDMDDWNRTRNESYYVKCACELLEHCHVESYEGDYFAVPNGYTLHPEYHHAFILPTYCKVEACYSEPNEIRFPNPSNFVEYLCRFVALDKLIALKCLLENNRVKFSSTKKGKLSRLFYVYQRWYRKCETSVSRVHCLQQVNEAVTIYNSYDYSLEQYNKLIDDEDARITKLNAEEDSRVAKLNEDARLKALAKLNWTDSDLIAYYDSLRFESLHKSELLSCRKELENYNY